MQRFDPDRLRSARKAAQVRPEVAAVAVDRSGATIHFWETGRVVPNAHQLATLAELYGVDTSDFYESGALLGAA